MSKRYLVTGGFGFIGSHLVEALLAARHSVQVVDDLSSNPVPLVPLLEEIGHERLTYRIEPIHRFGDRGMDAFDGVFHLASPVGPAGLLDQRGDIGTRILRDAGAVRNLAWISSARLVFVSTSEVYGGGVKGTCREDMPAIIPAKASARAEYAAAKLAAELVVLNADLDVVVVRPFNVAGPRQSSRGGFVLARFVEQRLKGEPLTIFGDGTQRRAFTHVKDIADGLIAAMERGKAGEVYNLGNPANTTTINDLAARVSWLSFGGYPITYTNGKAVYGEHYEETADKWPDATKAMKELDWRPTRGIDQTIVDANSYAQKAAAWSR